MPRNNMGFDFGLDAASSVFKRKNRWLFMIEGISASGIASFPPSKAARPSTSFKEIEAQHINETIYLPGKPEFKTVSLTLYEIASSSLHPVLTWLNQVYNPRQGTYSPSCDGFKKPQAKLELYDGCGKILETWVFESIWPQAVEFGDLDMASSDLVTCDITLRYDRAYVNGDTDCGSGSSGSGSGSSTPVTGGFDPGPRSRI